MLFKVSSCKLQPQVFSSWTQVFNDWPTRRKDRMGKHCGEICTFIVQVLILYCSSLFTALLHFTELGGHSILLLRSQLNSSSSLLQGGWGEVESLSCWLITVEQMDSLLLEEFTVRVLWFIQKHLSNSRWFHCVPLERDPCHSTVISININIVIEVRESGLSLRSVASFLWCFFFLLRALLVLALVWLCEYDGMSTQCKIGNWLEFFPIGNYYDSQ